MSQEEIKSTLLKMGYTLKDCGNHWRSNALYRGGNNPTSLMIYKDTGVWTDFVKNTASQPFKSLVKATTGEEIDDKSFSISGSNPSIKKHKPQITMEKIYNPSCLQKLIPHYIFYTDKGIKNSVLENLQGGLATEGAMYQRFVFPIFNKDGMIQGFSGRDMNPDSDRPKWKHIGKKTNWVYPMHNKVNDKFFFFNSVVEEKSIYMVESIGDILALHSAGIYNCICLFGTSISSRVICFLISLELNHINICLNNDSDKDKNRGEIGSLNCFAKLLNHFSKTKINICPPTLNDFGDMNEEEILSWQSNCAQKSDKEINNLFEKYYEQEDISKSSYESFKKNFK